MDELKAADVEAEAMAAAALLDALGSVLPERADVLADAASVLRAAVGNRVSLGVLVYALKAARGSRPAQRPRAV